jgi:hypothetical protein
MLSAFIFIPPILLSIFLTKLNNKLVTIACIVLISFFAFPQLYGKNYTVYSKDFYNFTPLNLDAVVMQTIWSGDSTTYPIAKEKSAIFEGKGKILSQQVSNSKRVYSIIATTPLKMVDRTFYFPGWKVLVDGVNVPIEYQDPNYRGVITYAVPSGNHTVSVVYTDTKARLLGKLLTILGTFLVAGLFFARKPLQNILIRNTK